MKKWLCANTVSLLDLIGCGSKANSQQHCRKNTFYIKFSNPTIDNHPFTHSLHLVKEIKKYARCFDLTISIAISIISLLTTVSHRGVGEVMASYLAMESSYDRGPNHLVEVGLVAGMEVTSDYSPTT